MSEAELIDASGTSDTSFEYMYVPINDLQVSTTENPKTGKKIVTNILVNDEPYGDSPRFWTSLFSRFGFNNAFFKYFDHAEVFERISSVNSSDRMRLCVEKTNSNGKQNRRLLAVSNPNKPVAPYNDLMGLLREQDGSSINYANGIVESTHIPMGQNKSQILGDNFENRYVIQTPIDGFGTPSVYLSMLRMVCSNGTIAMSKAFRTDIATGKGEDNVMPSILRVISGFNNEEGFVALRDRLEKAGKSWLSVYEYQQLYKLLLSIYGGSELQVNEPTRGSIIERFLLKNRDEVMGVDEGRDELHKSHILTAFYRMGGNPERRYGLANLEALSPKRQRTLPVECTMYDAINFVTEVATHHSTPTAHRKLQSWVGTTVSEEYDMEGTGEKFKEFSDFFLDSKVRNQMTGSKA